MTTLGLSKFSATSPCTVVLWTRSSLLVVSVLHNPHLGLSNTLEKLYNLAKNAADCVVPQEYGTTFEEKRSVGVKISKALLEKIKYVDASVGFPLRWRQLLTYAFAASKIRFDRCKGGQRG